MLELAKTPAHAGRRPFLDAEQLGLEQRLDQRRAVDGDKWPAAPAAELVNLSRDELLPRSRLAFERAVEIAFHGIAGQRVAERSQNFSDEIIEPFHVVLRPRITKCSATPMSASEAQADKRSVNSMSPANSRSG